MSTVVKSTSMDKHEAKEVKWDTNKRPNRTESRLSALCRENVWGNLEGHVYKEIWSAGTLFMKGPCPSPLSPPPTPQGRMQGSIYQPTYPHSPLLPPNPPWAVGGGRGRGEGGSTSALSLLDWTGKIRHCTYSRVHRFWFFYAMDFSYLCTYDLYGSVRNIFDTCRSIMRASGKGFCSENR